MNVFESKCVAHYVVEGFIDNYTTAPSFTTATHEEALSEFKKRVRRDHVEVSLYWVHGTNLQLLKEVNQ